MVFTKLELKYKTILLYLLPYIILPLNFTYADDAILQKSKTPEGESNAHIEIFSPQGTVKGVRQVKVRFSEQMVPFGEPRLLEPFEINCPVKGQARWADGKNWVYDFDHDLPAGIICEFNLKPDLKTISGKAVAGQQKFSFSTGGPTIKKSHPYEGDNIAEDQVFILALDGELKEESVLSNVYFSIEGINERVGVKILKGDERGKIPTVQRYKKEGIPHIVLQCRQAFPNMSKVSLVWGKGVKSLSDVPTTEDQVLPFKTRAPFTVRFGCERENPKADCIPILPMHLYFSAPVSWEYAGKIVMKGDKGKAYRPLTAHHDEESEEVRGKRMPEFVDTIAFKGPFPENSSFVIEIPKDIKDDAGRSLTNVDKFSITVKTAPYSSLAKFSARFGIIELKGDAMLPVTLRNLESQVKTRTLKIDEGGIVKKAKEGVLKKAVDIGESIIPILPEIMKQKGEDVVGRLKGKLHKVGVDEEERIIEWLMKVAGAGRRNSILTNANDVREFSLPKPSGAKAFEVVGIPLKGPGLYVAELESEILGVSLLGERRSMYVPTAALVTNLSAHFKWGRESSLIWVTTLDKADPVKDAEINIRDCNGKVLWKGKTDANGIAYIRDHLPLQDQLPYRQLKREEDSYYDSPQLRALNRIAGGLFIFAKKEDDMTFVHSSWDEGIEPSGADAL